MTDLLQTASFYELKENKVTTDTSKNTACTRVTRVHQVQQMFFSLQNVQIIFADKG